MGTTRSGKVILGAPARPTAARPSPLATKGLTRRHTVVKGTPNQECKIAGKIRAAAQVFAQISKRLMNYAG